MKGKMKKWCSLMLSAALSISGIMAANPALNVYAGEDLGVREEASGRLDRGTGEVTFAKAVNFTKVTIDDAFWGARQKQFICKVIPTAISNVESATGGIPNIKNTALMHRGEEHGNFQGAFYVDSDVHKVLESMCYALMIDPQGDAETIAGQEAIRQKLEEWIPYYQDAQEEDGYFDTYFTLGGSGTREKFSDFNLHELYCAGHFYEAAVAHYNATGGSDMRLLDMAVKNADYIASLFGVGKWKQVPGHQEIELALVKLAQLCTEIGGEYAQKADTYTELARFFLDTRGDYTDRHGTNHNSVYDQDHLPVSEQTSAVGHSVRAFYMYSGMVDVAMETGTDSYDHALLSLWEDVAKTKTYITGGVGAVAGHEGFGESYQLPNDTAYNETCASIANMMWNERMGRYFDDSKYADEMERALYNGIISCVNLDGDKFFYGNPMESQGGSSRSTWFGTACCPSNLVRFVESLGSYIYTQNEDVITLNLYIGNALNTEVNGSQVAFKVDTDMPWEGTTSITYHGEEDTAFTLRLRIPYWAKGENTLSINGEAVSAVPDEKGYVNVTRTWKPGDTLNLSLGMEVERVYSDERVTTNEGLVAIQRGPIVYAAEAIDNEELVFNYILPEDAEITTEKIEDIIGLNKEYKEVVLDPQAPKAQYAGIADQSVEAVAGEWDLYDPNSNIQIAQNADTGKTEIQFGKNTRVKAVYNYADAQEWTDFVAEAKLTLLDEKNTNCGIMFRVNGTVQDGADAYNGYYVGIGADSGGEGLIIGYSNAEKGWDRMDLISLNQDIKVGQEYTLRVAVRDDIFSIYVDDQFITAVSGKTAGYTKGTVGLRSYNQAFKVSEFTVRPFTEADIPDVQSYYLPSEDTYQVREAVILHANAEVFRPLTWEYEPAELTLVPYYTWGNRGKDKMTVYLQESKELNKYGNIARYATPSASAVSPYDTLAGLNDGTESRWTSYGTALNPWVELEFPWNVILNGSVVKWYSDGGGVQVPDGLTIQYWNGEEYVPVTPVGSYNTFVANTFNTYEFETIETTKLRMLIKNDTKRVASGIVEWEVLGTISPTEISMDQEALGMAVGESRFLTAQVKPAASEPVLTWSSDNEEVATVKDGLVTAVAPGEATITVETANHLKAFCSIVVTDTGDLEAAVKAALEAAATAKAEAQKAIEAAEAAREEAEKAKAEAKAAEEKAAAAQDEAQKAEEARIAAENAKAQAQNEVELARAQAEAAKAEAQAAKAAQTAAEAQAEAAKAQAEEAKTQVQLAKAQVEAAKAQAEEAKAQAVLAQTEAATAKNQVELAKAQAEEAKAQASKAKAEAEAAQAAQALAKAEAEEAKAQAEAAKAQAEAAKAEAEAAKAEAETARVEAQAAKAEAEAAKTAAQAAKEEADKAAQNGNTAKTVTITFDSAGGTKVEALTAEQGKTVSEPTAPSRRNYLFDGWYQGNEKYNFAAPVTGNLTLTAKWTKVSVGASKIAKVQKKAGGKRVIQAKKVDGAAKYQFTYATDKKFRKNVKNVNSSSRKVTLKNLKKGKTYYVKVRAFTYDSKNQKVYGKYSKVKKMVMKN